MHITRLVVWCTGHVPFTLADLSAFATFSMGLFVSANVFCVGLQKFLSDDTRTSVDQLN